MKLIETDIQEEATFMRKPIPSKVKLTAKLKFLSSGMTYNIFFMYIRLHCINLFRKYVKPFVFTIKVK